MSDRIEVTKLQIDPQLQMIINPLLERLNDRIERDAEVSSLIPDDQAELPGFDRRQFLKRVGGVAIATLATSALSGWKFASRENEGNPNRRWGMIIDLRRCVACRACVASCKNENKTPPGVAYMVFMEEEQGEFPFVKKNYFTRPCMQCEKSSCTTVCPTGATYHRKDGIVVVDYERCIGCRYCIAACPYGARSFDFGHDYIDDTRNPYNGIPSSEYEAKYGRRVKGASPTGNVRKCTFCLHLQDQNGEYREPPACSRTCMGRAIHFGDLKDPSAKCIVHGELMQELLARRSSHRLKEDLGNEPAVYYLT